MSKEAREYDLEDRLVAYAALVIAHYRSQSEEVAEMEDEAAYRKRKATFMGIPVALVPLVRRLLAKCAAV